MLPSLQRNEIGTSELLLEAQQAELTQLIDSAPPPAPRLHPKLAEGYRATVADLHAALNDPTARIEAAESLRGLIERVTVRADPQGHLVELTGDIVKLLTLRQRSRPVPEFGKGAGLYPPSPSQDPRFPVAIWRRIRRLQLRGQLRTRVNDHFYRIPIFSQRGTVLQTVRMCGRHCQRLLESVTFSRTNMSTLASEPVSVRITKLLKQSRDWQARGGACFRSNEDLAIVQTMLYILKVNVIAFGGLLVLQYAAHGPA
jgi:hypothetical protein